MRDTVETMANETKVAPNPDKQRLCKVGNEVRKRLAADPTAYKVPSDRAEVFAFSEFLNQAECDHIIRLVDDVAKPSEVFEEVYQAAYRTSYSGDVDRGDNVVKMVERRISDLLGIDLAWGEAVQGQRYRPKQEFKEHCDWFDTTSDYWQEEIVRGGQRSWTAMAFLNDVEEGGETRFPKIGIQIPPQAGALLVWNNCLADGSPNPDTLHAASPVKQGVKYVVTKWFRTRRWT